VTETGPGRIDETPPNETTKLAFEPGREIVGSAGLTLVGSIFGAAMGMTNDVLAAHFLGVEAYGSYGLALMLAKVGEIFALFGIPLSVIHFLPVHLSRSQSGLALGVVIGSTLMPVTVGAGFVLGAFFWHDWIATKIFNQPEAAAYIAVIACAIPFTSLTDLFGSIARGFGLYLPYVVIRNLVPPLCYLTALVYLFAAMGPEVGVAYGYTAAAAIGAMVGLAWVVELVRTRLGLVRPELRLTRLYGYSAPIALNFMVAMVFLWVDLFLLARLTDAETVGIYRGCTQILITFDLVLTACSVASAPVYSILHARGDPKSLQETLTSATRIATMLAIPLMLVLLVNGRDILGLLGPDFEAGALALSILAVGQCVKVVFGSASITLIMCGRQGLDAGNTAFAACLNVALNLALVPSFGLVGAAIATAISLVVLSAVRCLLLRAVLGLHVADFAPVLILSVSTTLAALVWAASLLLGAGQGTGFVHLGLRLIAMGGTIGGGLWHYCFRSNDRNALLGAIFRHRHTTASGERGS
jgi:O-antigen/teichoic acid export membrane protein